MTSSIIAADEWFEQGTRILYDPIIKRIVKKETPNTVHVWERVVAPLEVCSQTRWLTLLGSPPDGSYSYSKVDGELNAAPRLYIDFVGQGDSDTPKNYKHTIQDCANQVEAHWRAHKIRRTVLVSPGCSSMVMMELLNRQTERLSLGLPVRTRIEHVLTINGGYFARAHKPHPLNSNPVVFHTVGKAAAKAAQHSNIVLDPIIKGCFPKSYDLSKEEMREIGQAMRRRDGLRYFSGTATRYIEQHKQHEKRWDLVNVYAMTRRQGISFTIVGGKDDMFEAKSFKLAQEKLQGRQDIYFELIDGGFKLATEHPHRIAELIDAVATLPAYDESLYDNCPGSGLSASKRYSMSSNGSATDSTASLSGTSSSVVWDTDFANSEYELPTL